MTQEDVVLEVKGLQKLFRIGFFRKKVHAVRGVDFKIGRGEIFGLLGPNGAGKTTTIKAILRLIRPTEGEIKIFGLPPSHLEAARRIGYMPENPYIYQYLKPLEFLDLCGRLVGMPAEERRTRSIQLAEQVGLSHALERPIGKFSKGMMQRVGLAQALLHDPELLILDEPMSGLDPIGRKEIRDVLLEQRRRGKTLLFTSHILSDVEMLCDRVVIMQNGKITSEGHLNDLLSEDEKRIEIHLGHISQAFRKTLETHASVLENADHVVSLRVEGQQAADSIVKGAVDAGAQVLAVLHERETLEELFVRNAVRSS